MRPVRSRGYLALNPEPAPPACPAPRLPVPQKLQLAAFFALPIVGWLAGRGGSVPVSNQKNKNVFRAFLDYFVLFSGISTASNLARTQGRALLQRGIFLFRSPSRR